MTDGKGPDRDPVSSTGYPLAFYRCGIPSELVISLRSHPGVHLARPSQSLAHS